MNHKRLVSWGVALVMAACSLPLASRFGSSCAWYIMVWCNAYPQAMLLVTALVILLLAGSVLLGVWSGIVQLRRTAHLLHALHATRAPVLPAELQQLSRQLGLAGRLDLLVTPTPLAYCYGLVRPRICVTSGLLSLLSGDELMAVLQHERAHLYRRDPLRILAWTVCDGICWWSPRARAEALLRSELAADQAVIQAGGRTSLARAVLKLMTHAHQQAHTLPADLALSTLSATEARIDQLLQPDRAVPCAALSLSSRLVPLIGLVALAACLLTMVSSTTSA